VIKNAIEAITARTEAQLSEGISATPGQVGLSLDRVGDHARIRVTDNGIGLPKKERKTVVEPYVTTKSRGTGLGLAIVKRMVEEHGGKLSLSDNTDSNINTGTCVELTLSGVVDKASKKMRHNNRPQEAVA